MKTLFNKLRQTISFYVNNSPLELRYCNVYYSQFGEDVVLSQLFKNKSGFYIDVGAYHPFNFSNTYLFYKAGWRGLNIEPNPYGFSLLKRFRSQDKNLNFAVATVAGPVNFKADSTFSHIIDSREMITSKDKQIVVEAMPLREILDHQIHKGQVIDFMSVDCEGHDLQVLQSNNWEIYKPRAIIVEDHYSGDNTDIDKELTSHNYKLYCRMGLSKIYLESEK